MRKKIQNRNSNSELPLWPLRAQLGRRLMEMLRRYPLRCSLAASAFYTLILLFLGQHLRISSNYFVIFPVLAVAFGFGFWGGLISGILALPANLLLFYIIGHPEFSPESKLIAEISGIIIGSSAGYVGDYFHYFQQELTRRKEVEDKLRSALDEKEILLREVHHRVKNNLMMITSLARLHSRRVDDSEFKKECDTFVQRIHSISLVHDLLYPTAEGDKIRFGEYIAQITNTLVSFYPIQGLSLTTDIGAECSQMSIDNAVPVGMIVNELVTNALKHAYSGIDDPLLHISVGMKNDSDTCLELIVRDNGTGWKKESAGLGGKLIPLLSRQIKGSFSVESAVGEGKRGTVCTLVFPLGPELSCNDDI